MRGLRAARAAPYCLHHSEPCAGGGGGLELRRHWPIGVTGVQQERAETFSLVQLEWAWSGHPLTASAHEGAAIPGGIMGSRTGAAPAGVTPASPPNEGWGVSTGVNQLRWRWQGPSRELNTYHDAARGFGNGGSRWFRMEWAAAFRGFRRDGEGSGPRL